MLKLSQARKQEKRKAREDDREGNGRSAWETRRGNGGHPEQAREMFNLNPPLHTPEFSHLGQDPAPIQCGRQLAKPLSPHTIFF